MTVESARSGIRPPNRFFVDGERQRVLALVSERLRSENVSMGKRFHFGIPHLRAALRKFFPRNEPRLSS